ncbi:acyl-CoA thioesterase [Chitinophaga nivalis]|uniref:Thioesterase family protein n=1 Tax=Chitinophaga nivalis TaxID=2991709 RepID=A0ABT3IMU0_9BACT|nr:thioesterase family protein [Chitinophaga nivalis]MCW3465041.1 thioesterase family protein [Chitinophaga nivalis]MCW3485267.1 thioesterase family protein [Chitinophaga nivalis]
MDNAEYFKTFAVKWSDFDVNRHLRNTSYSEYATHVRMSFLEDHGYAYPVFEELQIGPILTQEDISYLKETQMNSELKVNMRILALSAEGSLFRLKHEFFQADGTLAARMLINGAWLDRKRRRPTIPPDGILQAFKQIPRDVNYDAGYFDATRIAARAKES